MVSSPDRYRLHKKLSRPRKSTAPPPKPPVRISSRRSTAPVSFRFGVEGELVDGVATREPEPPRVTSRRRTPSPPSVPSRGQTPSPPRAPGRRQTPSPKKAPTPKKAATPSPKKSKTPSPRKPAAPSGVKRKAIKLIVEEREDLQLLPVGYEMGHRYGGRLDETQADISDSIPLVKDRRRFQAAQHQGQSPDLGFHLPAALAHSKKGPEIKCLHLGISNALAPWYSAPFPAEYFTKDGQLWMCEWCLKYIRTQKTMKRHVRKCSGRPPPGKEIYRHGNLSVFEVNGRTAKPYCQNLCLLAKMFLDHKTLYYDTETFLFYVLIEWHPVETLKSSIKPYSRLCHYSLVGYFSKEKNSPSNYNVSCILTLPNHQRKGYGYFLIDFSYLLSRIEEKHCSPEKPLSDLGLVSYVSYWTHKVMSYIDAHQDDQISVDTICEATGMTANDVLGVLEHHGCVRWSAHRNAYDIIIDGQVLRKHREKVASKTFLNAYTPSLRWSPYTCSR